MLPLAGLGLGLAWQRWAAHRWIAAALLGLSAYSCAAIWVRFAAWH
jgi:hypothetical protein